jgi:molybdopterin/thiamine biosynthesis adenylyltransferase
VREFDSEIDVRWIDRRLTAANAPALIAGASLVLDGCDNFATRLAVSDACVASGIPLLSAAVGRFQGQVGAFAGHLADQPCYRCYVGDAFDADDCDTCADEGMLGAMSAWTATFATMQAIRVLLAPLGGMGDPQWGKLHLLDGLTPAMRTMRIAKDPACRGCGTARG